MARVNELEDERSAFTIKWTFDDFSADIHRVLARIVSPILVVLFTGLELKFSIFGVNRDEVEINIQIAA